LNGSRRWAAGEHGAAVVVKELRDGRIVVAGGEERHRIAVLHERATQPDAPDRFVGIGDYTPSRTHEIYDPHAKAWRESAPSRSEGTHVAILDDGRVVKWGVVVADAAPVSEKSADQAEQTRAILEVSDTNGKSWRPFGAQGAPAITTDMIQRPARPFVVQGELFLSCRTAIRWRSSPPATTIRPSRNSFTTTAAPCSPAAHRLLPFRGGRPLRRTAGFPCDAPVMIRRSTLPSGLTASKAPSASWPSAVPSSSPRSTGSQTALSNPAPAGNSSGGATRCVLRVLSPLTPPATRIDPSFNLNTCASVRMLLREDKG